MKIIKINSHKRKSKYLDYGIKEVHHKKRCTVCNKPLVRFRLRDDLSNRKDWSSRTMHLKCWISHKK